MEINNSYSQNLYQSKTSSAKNVDEGTSDNSTFNIFEKLIDKSKVSEIKSSAYYDNSNISSTSNVTYDKSLVKWENQVANPHYQYLDSTLEEIVEKSKETDPKSYEWFHQMRIATNGNKYEDAPEFETFVKKWMDKGYTETQALGRAEMYARAGLLDYGKQKLIPIGTLAYGDTKQHGMHLINNEPLNKAMLEVLDSLNELDVTDFVSTIFEGYPTYTNAGIPISFQELLNNFGVKLEDLRKENPETAKDEKFTFTGDINLKDGKEFQEYNNFIFDTLIEYFKDSINNVNKIIEERNPNNNKDFTGLKDSLNLLITTFQKEVDVYNSETYGNK